MMTSRKDFLKGIAGAAGVAARCGLHCSPLAHRSAGTLDTGTLRFSFSPFTGTDEVEKACRILKKIIHEEI